MVFITPKLILQDFGKKIEYDIEPLVSQAKIEAAKAKLEKILAKKGVTAPR